MGTPSQLRLAHGSPVPAQSRLRPSRDTFVFAEGRSATGGVSELLGVVGTNRDAGTTRTLACSAHWARVLGTSRCGKRRSSETPPVRRRGQAPALHWLLRHAVHDRRLRQTGRFQHRRGQVDDVLKLRENLTLGPVPFGQWITVALRVEEKVASP